MTLGGGTWVTQNKVLPGSYINVISMSAAATPLSERGYAAVVLPLSWGEQGWVITVTKADFFNNSKVLFGFDVMHGNLWQMRELFKHAHTVYIYNAFENGMRASNDLAQALYPGEVGNRIVVSCEATPDDANVWVVETKFDGKLVDSQTVTSAEELVGNDYVSWNRAATLAEKSALLTGGTNGEQIESHQKALNELEAYAFNVLVCDDSSQNNLYVAYTKRMRDEVGKKFQTVICDDKSNPVTANYEGIVVLPDVSNMSDGAFWVAGALAGCEVNKSLTNSVYDGEINYFTSSATQSTLIDWITKGYFVFHNDNGTVRVLEDINSYVDNVQEKSSDFKYNQTIRVVDQVAIDIASIFNRNYLGKVPNNKSGRTSLWNDIVKHHEQLLKINAIENYDGKEHTVVSAGDTKRSVVVTDEITVVNAMAQLYMTVIVK